MAIYLTADLHFGHDKSFIWKERGFNSVKEMNWVLLRNWNSVVTDEDDVYVLGDLMLGEEENIEYVKRLKGKIHIVLGNHDSSKRKRQYEALENVVEIAEVGIKLKYNKYSFLLTHYPMITANFEIESLKQIKINLYGHTHQKDNPFYNDLFFAYNVGVDCHDNKPVLLDDVIEEIKKK